MTHDQPPLNGSFKIHSQIHSLIFPQCPPELSYSSSTLLLEATVQSPLHIMFPESTSSDESTSDAHHLLTRPSLSRQSRSRSPGKSRTSRQLFPQDRRGHSRSPARAPDSSTLNQSLSAQERLHSLLSSYAEPEGERGMGSGQEGIRSPYRVKFKPTHPKTRHISGKVCIEVAFFFFRGA